LREPFVADSVRNIAYDFNDIAYRVSTAAPGLLVTVEQWDPDWQVTVDGKAATLERVNYFMRGVLLEPGVHDVRYRYRPRALEAGIRISTAALVVTLIVAVVGIVVDRRRRRGTPPPPEGPAGPGDASPAAPRVERAKGKRAMGTGPRGGARR
jgi:hypothetical protein